MPDEPDVTKDSGKRLEDLTAAIQPRPSQPVPVIHGDLPGLTRPTVIGEVEIIWPKNEAGRLGAPDDQLNLLMGKIKRQIS